MDCSIARDAILDALATGTDSAELVAHLATCADCGRFAARQRALDAKLTAALVAPDLSLSFRPALRARIQRERRRVWLDAAPDVVHVTSWVLATTVCAVLTPASMTMIVGAGAVAALSTYVALTILRDSLENAD